MQVSGLRIGLFAVVVALVSGCVSAESVVTRLREDQRAAAAARAAAEQSAGRQDQSGAVAAAVDALRASRDAQAWVDAYVTVHGDDGSVQFAHSLRRISEDVDAARAAAVHTGATAASIDAAAAAQGPRVQAGGGGGGGGGGM